MNGFSDRILTWYEQHGRKNLPWQQDRDAYRIWISEIMLQQTRVDTTIPYYEKFIRRFPVIEELAAADLDEVLQYWSGLGYYARARNAHKTAQIICQQHHAEFPQEIGNVMAFPGIGRSTAAAILSLSFDQPHAILDGNVKRVLARVFAVRGWPGAKETERRLWRHAEALLPAKRHAEYTQAMMDMGSMLCKRVRPDCERCPVRMCCEACAQQCQHELPTPKPAKKLPQREVLIAVIQDKNDQSIWLEKRPYRGIWGGLYSFPEFANEEQLLRWVRQRYRRCTDAKPLSSLQHVFSHFRLTMHPRFIQIGKQPIGVMEDMPGLWYKGDDQRTAIGLAAPVKSVLVQVT